MGRQAGTDGRGGGRRARHTRTQLFESISGNRAKITRAMNSLRDALVRAVQSPNVYAYRNVLWFRTGRGVIVFRSLMFSSNGKVANGE